LAVQIVHGDFTLTIASSPAPKLRRNLLFLFDKRSVAFNYGSDNGLGVRLRSALAEVVANPNRALRHCVAAELLSKIGHIVQIELWADEQMLREEELDADSGMHLEMVSVPYRLGHVGTNSGSHARILCEGKTSSGASNSALQLQLHTLFIYGRVDAVEIVECLAVLQRTIVALGRLQIDFSADTEMLPEHYVAA